MLARVPVPIVVHKGRGAVANPAGRFDRHDRVNEHDGWAAPDAPPRIRTVVSEEHPRRIISRNKSPDIAFEQSINPYRGCEHGCIYCYARPNHAYMGLSPGQDFESKLFAKPEAARLLRQELGAPGYRCTEINIGAATDAYQPIERDWRITREVIEVLAQCRHPLSIITKSTLVERDIDLLAPMARQGLVYVGVTITTLDADLARIWEPRAAAPWRRLETIRRLSEAGIPVGVLIAPIVPFINDQDIEKIMKAAHEAGARFVHHTVLRLPWELEEVFVGWLRQHFPDREKRVLAKLFSLRGNGRLNQSEFFTRMKGQGPWAELIRMRMGLSARKLGLDNARLNLRTDLFEPPSTSGQMGLF